MTQPATRPDAYADPEWCAFVDAYRDATGAPPREATVTAILDAVAPAIAARALREAADLVAAEGQFERIKAQRVVAMCAQRIRARADQIEAGR